MKNRTGLIWILIGVVVACGLIGGILVLGSQFFSSSGDGAQDATGIPIEPIFTPATPPNRIILVWGQQGDHIFLENETQYWDKYQSGSELPGLYLRSDSIDSFGDYLELFPGGIFSLELDNLDLTGIWNLEGANLILTVDKP